MSVAMEERSPLLNGSIGATNGTANGSAGPGLNSNASNGGCTGNGTLVHTATRTTTSQTALPFTCSGCGKPIVDKYLLKVRRIRRLSRTLFQRNVRHTQSLQKSTNYSPCFD